MAPGSHLLFALDLAASPGRAARPSQGISEAQWLVYFCAELTYIAPGIGDAKAFSLAVAARGLAPASRPELTAVGMAAGAMLIRLH